VGSERVSIPNAKSGFQSEWFFRLGGYKGRTSDASPFEKRLSIRNSLD